MGLVKCNDCVISLSGAEKLLQVCLMTCGQKLLLRTGNFTEPTRMCSRRAPLASGRSLQVCRLPSLRYKCLFTEGHFLVVRLTIALVPMVRGLLNVRSMLCSPATRECWCSGNMVGGLSCLMALHCGCAAGWYGVRYLQAPSIPWFRNTTRHVFCSVGLSMNMMTLVASWLS